MSRFAGFPLLKDRSQRFKEGWAIFMWSDGKEAIKCDNRSIFATDGGAIEFVKRRASEGSQYHQQALLYVIQNRLTR